MAVQRNIIDGFTCFWDIQNEWCDDVWMVGWLIVSADIEDNMLFLFHDEMEDGKVILYYAGKFLMK